MTSTAYSTPIGVSGTVTSQSSVGAVVMDKVGDGASVTGNTSAGKISAFEFDNAPHRGAITN